MGMGFAPTWLRQVSPPASLNHFNHCLTPIFHDRSIYATANELSSALCGLCLVSLNTRVHDVKLGSFIIDIFFREFLCDHRT